MLRIHFTGEDLTRLVFMGEPDPLWEVSISLHRLQRRDAGVLFGPWRTRVLPRVPAGTRMLSFLAPARGYCVDFLTPTLARGASLADQAEDLRATPTTVVRNDLQEFRRQHPAVRFPSWSSRLAEGGTEAMDRLARAATDYFDACLAPYWEHVRGAVAQDRLRRTTLLAKGGLEAALSTLHPSARWRYPVLELDYPVDRDLHLQGRGLVLQPSFFCRYSPTGLYDPDRPPVLVYPITHQPGWTHSNRAAPAPAAPLIDLLGGVRARLLQATADGTATTGELARLVGTTPSNASRHLSALREAALVYSGRHRNTTLYTITPLGIALLNGRQPHLTA
ncbi:helix-turn-helix domain-containing protein [Streptomyces sp. NPDC003006]